MITLCYKLESIELDGFKLSRDQCIWLGTCEQLESISISNWTWSEIADIKALFKNKKRLKSMELTDTCIGEVLLELGINCPLLEHLKIKKVEDTKHFYIEVFTQGCTKLKSLELGDIFYTNDNFSPVRLTDNLIESLGQNCPWLESLIINSGGVIYPNDISEVKLKSFAQGCPLLKTLHIDGIWIASFSAKHLVDHCPLLADISLSCCDFPNDDELAELSKSKSLTRLDISYCDFVTDTGIDALVKGCGGSLEFLCIAHCTELTDASLSSISDHCPNLHTLHLGANHQTMTFLRMVQLVENCERLVEFKCSCSGALDLSLIERILKDRRNVMTTK